MTRNPLTTEFTGMLCPKNRGLHARPVYLIRPARHRRNSPVVCDKAYLPVATALPSSLGTKKVTFTR